MRKELFGGGRKVLRALLANCFSGLRKGGVSKGGGYRRRGTLTEREKKEGLEGWRGRVGYGRRWRGREEGFIRGGREMGGYALLDGEGVP